MESTVTNVSIGELLHGLSLILRCLGNYAEGLTEDRSTNSEAIRQLIGGLGDAARTLDGKLDALKGDLVDLEACAPGKERARRKEIYGTTVIPC